MLPMAQGYFYYTSRHKFHIRRRCIDFCMWVRTTEIRLLYWLLKKKRNLKRKHAPERPGSFDDDLFLGISEAAD
jgi:hypothetical protein